MNDWENPARQGRGRQPPHVDVIPFPSVAAARESERRASPYLRSLNGAWRFRLYHSPQAVPPMVTAPAFADGEWETIAVPGNWQLHGHDIPYYTDNQLPFPPDDLPRVPATNNPTGVYRCRFDRPAGWEQRRVFLTFHGVDSAFHAWINGTEIGFSKDSRLPAEFDVTEAVQAQGNVLVVRVYRWSDGTYVENQDMWRLSGIFRDVELWTADVVHVRDVQVRTELDQSYRHAQVHIGATVVNDAALDIRGVRVAAWLLDAAGREATAPAVRAVELAGQAATTLTWTLPLHDARLWSAESPYLYKLLIETQAGGQPAGGQPAGGQQGDVVRVRVGVREVVIRGAQLCVNGRPILVAGVNRHEHDPVTGHTVSEATMRCDIELMKRFNINAVRTSHYPNHPLWYDLCDEYGIYVLDEANLECDGALERLADDPEWEAAFLNRVQRMVQRDRNHPCVIAWSLGNESGLGRNHRAAAGWLRQADPTRPIHYHPAGDDPITDIVAPMYPSIDELEALAQQLEARSDPRPIIMCEYAHSMGNATGNLGEYWQIVERYPRVQGGFVWDWVDQGFRRVAGDGQPYWAYGGDFGDVPNDGNFCLDGLVGPDRTPHPALWELRKMAEPLRVLADDVAAGCIRVTNRRHTLGTDDLALHWQLEVEGVALQHGCVPLPQLAPAESARLWLPLIRPGLPYEGERWLNLRFVLQQATAYAPAGHIVAWEQFALDARPGTVSGGITQETEFLNETRFLLAPDLARLQVVREAAWQVAGEGDRLLQFKCGRVGVTFDRQAGRLAGYQLDGRPLLEEAPVLSVWRAPTDNDEGLWGVDKMAIQWRDAGLDRLAATVRSVELGQDATHGIHIRVEETWRPELAGAPARSGRWDFLLLMLRMHLFQFWTPAALAVLADELGLQPPLEAAHTRSKFDYVRALVQFADENEKSAALLSAAHTALQAAPNPHALASFERRLAGFLHQDAQQLAAAFALEYPGGFDCTTTYRLLPSGALELALEVQPFGSLPRLPRLGVRLALPARYRHVTWFGRGPHENYPDRKCGAAVGRYCGSVDGQFVPYGRPQENGNKCDVRWSMLTDDSGCGVHFAGDRLMNFGVQRYTAADLAAAQHLHELHPRPRTYCTFDCLMSGLGNESCGPGVLPAYQIPPAAQAFVLRLHPVLNHAP